MLLTLRLDRELDWRAIAHVLSDDEEATDASLTRDAAALRKRFERIKESDGWWCLTPNQGYMTYCRGTSTAGGCPCASCTATGVAATCANPPPPAACGGP